MYIDDLIELSKHVTPEILLDICKQYEKENNKTKTQILNVLKEHNYDYSYIELLFKIESLKNYDKNDIIKLINQVVTDQNAEDICNLLDENFDITGLDDIQNLIPILKYLDKSGFNKNLVSLVEKRFRFDGYNIDKQIKEALNVLKMIDKLHYADSIIAFVDSTYDNTIINFGDWETNYHENHANNGIDLFDQYTKVFDTKLLDEKFTFYEASEFVCLDDAKTLIIFGMLKNLTKEQKKNDCFLKQIDQLLRNKEIIEYDTPELLHSYISLYEDMKKKNLFIASSLYLKDIIKNFDEKNDIEAALRLFVKYNDEAREFLVTSDIIENMPFNMQEYIVEKIEEIPVEQSGIKKAELYHTMKAFLRHTLNYIDRSSFDACFDLMKKYNYDSELLQVIQTNGSTTIDAKKYITQLNGAYERRKFSAFEDEICACTSQKELTEYLTLLKADMVEGKETLDLTPKTLVKKREDLKALKTNTVDKK